MRPFAQGTTTHTSPSSFSGGDITATSVASSGAITGTTITGVNSGSSSYADASSQPGIFSAGGSPSSDNLVGIVIEKSGYEELFLGISKHSGLGEYGANSLYLSTYTANGLWGIGRGNGNGLISYADIQNDSSGNIIINRALALNTTQTTTSSCVFSQPHIGNSHKEVVIYYVSGATATYNFPVAFTNTPGIVVASNGPAASVVTSLSASSVTVSGGSTTGFIFLRGF